VRSTSPLRLVTCPGVLALVVTAFGVAPGGGAAQDAPADLRARIEAAQPDGGDQGLGVFTLEELLLEFAVPSVSIAVIHDFDVHWSAAYGLADTELRRPADVETVFQAASISKPVAAMAVVRAAEDGRFGLDDDVNTILRSWQLDGEGFTAARPVTPRSLTSHTSGLGDGFGFPGDHPDDAVPTLLQILDGAAPSNVGRLFMEREPLTAYEYSGGGVTLMQQALQDAHGRPFDEILTDEVLDPIGMAHSTYAQPLPPEWDRNAARAHDREGRAMDAKWHVYPEQAAAGLWTTPTDLARFAIEVQRALRDESGRVLTRQGAREMVTPVGVGPYAVGFSIAKRGEGWYFSHGGSNWGFRASLVAHTAKGYGVAIMTNGDRGSELIAELQRRVERAYAWDSIAEPVRRGYGR
jgi:CubicO group peptidase (beta-lactamase class C family)